MQTGSHSQPPEEARAGFPPDHLRRDAGRRKIVSSCAGCPRHDISSRSRAEYIGDIQMTVAGEAAMLIRMARWALALARHDTHGSSPVPENPKFMSAQDAAGMIRDGSVVAASGIGVHQRASILY